MKNTAYIEETDKLKGTVMETLKRRALIVKEHVARNKAAYIASTVAVLAIALQQANRVAFYKFLDEKGIDPMEYYSPEAYEELNL